MKRERLFTLLVLIATVAILTLVGCKKNDNLTSISLKDHDPNVAVEIEVGEFDYSAYTVIMAYESGRTEELALTEEMIEETDLFKLYQIGEHEITVRHAKQAYTFKVSVKRSTFADLSLPENNVFTYDGTAHTIEVDGNIPANAVVTYLGGNSFVNAGTYDVTAVVSCEGYVTETLSTTVTIERAKYDMSGVKLEGKEVVYDGTAHSLEISGTLPEGVSAPTYTIDEMKTESVTDVGEYTVVATFANKDPNYEDIPAMEATLKITPAKYTVKGVDLVFKNAGEQIISNDTKIYDGKIVTFDLNDYNKLSEKLSVSFLVCDQDEKVLATSNQNTHMINVGVYTVKVEFSMEDGKNYEPIEPLVRTFEVLPADHPPIENIQFISAQTIYDGKAHSLEMEGKLPAGVTVSYEYYKDGDLVLGADGKAAQSVTDAGRYTVKAVFSHTDMNYKELSPLSATLNIEQVRIDTLALIFKYEKTWVYDGTPRAVELREKPDHLEVRYEYYRSGSLVKNADGTPATAVTEIGEYTVKAIVTAINQNYAPVEPITLTFSIVAPTT